MIDDRKLALLQCTICKSDLANGEDCLICQGCGARYPVVGDIVIMLTRDGLDSFTGETWGQELYKEARGFWPGFTYVCNETDPATLRKIFDEGSSEGRASKGIMTDEPQGNWGLPDEEFAAANHSIGAMLQLCKVPSASTIVDWPTGWGTCLKQVVKQARPDALVAALEITFRTLAKIKPYYDDNGYSKNILFVVADARNLPLKDSVFQAATVWGVNEIERPEAGFAETYRVLDSNAWVGTYGEQYAEGSASMQISERLGMASVGTRVRLESVMAGLGFRDLQYQVLFEGYDHDELPDEERCPLPARGDWFQCMVAAGQK